MKSNLLKLTSVLSVAAFMVVTMFSTPAQAELVNANDVVVETTYDRAAFAETVDKHTLIYKCFLYQCEIDAAVE